MSAQPVADRCSFAAEQHQGLAVQADWTFSAQSPHWRRRAWVAAAYLGRSGPMPAMRVLREPTPAVEGWCGYFIYAPDGRLQPHHHYTLAKLRSMRRRLAVVIATDRPEQVPLPALHEVDALVWKALPGYDWSAYALLIRLIARFSAGSPLLLLNDSVLGPFSDLQALMPRLQRWSLAGLTSTNQVENHLQSYCLHLSGVDLQTVHSLRPLFPAGRCLNNRLDVVLCQETRWARLASATMSVGSLLHVHSQGKADLTLQQPLTLLQRGLPFIKRSLLRALADGALKQALLATLLAHGHPLTAEIGA